MLKLARSRLLPWIILACILTVYAISVVRLHPTNFFGFMEDDTIYFSSAQALAQGHGYILPSVPGSPPATKYPILYPWILSWVWRWNPSFPANLRDAIGLNIVFGFFFLAAAFVFLRRMKGLNDAEALAITAFCALHPILNFYTANLLSEISFSALALWTLILADKSTKPESKLRLTILCGILAGISTQLHFVGLAIIAGIGLAALLRRAWRQLFAFSLSSGAFILPGLLRAFFSPPAATKFALDAASSLSWAREWAYYMNYPAFYRMSVPNTHFFLHMLAANLWHLAIGPVQFFLFPGLAPHVVGELLLTFAGAVLIWVGILRRFQFEGPKPIYLALIFFVLIALVWDYPMFTRFFIPFLPLLVAILWIETEHALSLAWKAISHYRLVEAVPVGTLALAIGAVAVILPLNVVIRGTRFIRASSFDRASILKDKREAYRWISSETPKNCRVIAYEDGAAYQYTGRQSMRPITLTIQELYNPSLRPKALEHITDVARTIDAQYWIISADDYRLDNITAMEGQQKRVRAIEEVSPLLFQSKSGRVRIYGLKCVQQPEASGCEAADRVLFPESQPRTAANP